MRVTASDGVSLKIDGEAVKDFIAADDVAGWVRVSADVVRRGKVEISEARDFSSLAKAIRAKK